MFFLFLSLVGTIITQIFFSDENVVIPSMLATFTIGFGAEEDIEKVPDNQLPGTKIIENGVLYLLYQGTKYDVQGNRVR